MYKMVEIVGVSPEGYDAAVRQGVEAAVAQGLKVSWFEVVELRGGYHNSRLEFQVKIRLGVHADKL
ncbi:MAG: hypothetical protein Kow0059_21330 [Candidatus Sumerlaeia bacterium]